MVYLAALSRQLTISRGVRNKFITIRARAEPFIQLKVTLIIDVDSVLWLLHHAEVGDVVGVSEVYAASIFRVEQNRHQ
jgi:hypothetical protein